MSDTVEPALTPEEWRCLTAGGVQKHAVSDAIEAAERGRMDLTPHGLAALALHGQSFGFTRDDVAFLEACENWNGMDYKAWLAYVQSLRARLAALLPPEGT